MSKAALHTVGRVVGVHGIRGELRVLPYGDLTGVDWSHARLEGPDARSFEVEVTRIRAHKGMLIVLLSGVDARTDAESLVGMELKVPESSLPETGPGEYYHFELIGLGVETTAGEKVGRVKGVMTTGAADVLEIETPSGAELLVPISPVSVIEIDIESNRVVVELLEGMEPEDRSPKRGRRRSGWRGKGR